VRSVRVLSSATIVLLVSACSSPPAQRVPAASERTRSEGAQVHSPPDAGRAPYRVESDALARFIRFQERVLSLHAKMLSELARAERVDSGTATVAAIRRYAQAQELARLEVGLTERDVEELEAVVTDVISRRAALAGDDAEETLREMEALAARLPAEQRAEFDATLAPLRRQSEESRRLAAQRERYGADNVDRVLEREAELTEQWNRAIAIFSGIAPERPRPASARDASLTGVPDAGTKSPQATQTPRPY
jgi:hypothetical protein